MEVRSSHTNRKGRSNSSQAPKTLAWLVMPLPEAGPHFEGPSLRPGSLGSVSANFGVHMVKGMQCIECHHFKDHKAGLVPEP